MDALHLNVYCMPNCYFFLLLNNTNLQITPTSKIGFYITLWPLLCCACFWYTHTPTHAHTRSTNTRHTSFRCWLCPLSHLLICPFSKHGGRCRSRQSAVGEVTKGTNIACRLWPDSESIARYQPLTSDTPVMAAGSKQRAKCAVFWPSSLFAASHRWTVSHTATWLASGTELRWANAQGTLRSRSKSSFGISASRNQTCVSVSWWPTCVMNVAGGSGLFFVRRSSGGCFC